MGREAKETFKYNGGIVDYVRHLNNTKESLFRKVGYFEQTEENQEVELAFQWNTGYYESIYSFANGISTIEGGMHEEGFRKALTNVVKSVSAQAQFVERERKTTSRAKTSARVCTRDPLSQVARDPQFEGQTKGKLGNVSIRSMVERATNEKLAEWLEENPREGSQIVAKAISASRARMAAQGARDLTRRKNALDGAGLPGKLVDCSSNDPRECELFIVEGNSAGGFREGRSRPSRPGDSSDSAARS